MKQQKLPKVRFHHTPLHRRVEPHPLMFLIERSSFWIATLSVVAFLVGNMVGRHGWYTFWNSVWGEGSSATIVYTGTVPPVEKVPDYVRWAQEYGGDPHLHTFRQVPQDLLVDLPQYDSLTQIDHQENSTIGQVYSVGYMGAYSTGGERDGSHPGVDIRMPVGTPILSIANGVVTEVKEGDAGFGTFIVIEHPNVPDPANPKQQTTTIYSIYAHLSVAYIEEGMVVHKGERIALSGKSGFVSGPHLHFQIDRDDAPWHPYWPFTTSDARKAGYSTADAVNAGLHQAQGLLYTVHPMLYVQSHYATPATLVASADSDEVVDSEEEPEVKVAQRPLTLAERVSRMRSIREERIRQRLARRKFSTVVQADTVQPVLDSVVVSKSTIVSASLDEPTTVPSATPSQNAEPVHTVSVEHDGSFSGRSWERIEITLLNTDGQRVSTPNLRKDIYLRTAFGKSEFRPTVLKAEDFVNGSAVVYMLPRGQRTVVISVQPFNVLSRPMKYQR